MSGPVETKTAAGGTVTLISGYIAWVLVTYVPVIKSTVPLDIQGQLPFMIATVLGAMAAYAAPHTHRPDLAEPVLPPGTTMTPVGPIAPLPAGYGTRHFTTRTAPPLPLPDPPAGESQT